MRSQEKKTKTDEEPRKIDEEETVLLPIMIHIIYTRE